MNKDDVPSCSNRTKKRPALFSRIPEKPLSASAAFFTSIFSYLLLTKAYSHILPEINADVYIFGHLFPEKAVWIIPALFSFPVSFIAALAAFIILEKFERLSLANRDMMEVNILLEREIQERIKIQKELEESEKRFRDMTDLLPSAICEVDPDMNITYANELGLKLFEISSEELAQGFNGLCLIHPEEIAATGDRVARLMQGELIDSIETRMCTKNGRIMHVLRNTNVIRKNGEIKGLRLCITDISGQKAMQRELMHSNRMKSVAVLAGGIAHKFNNLLNIITGHLELIQLENEENESVTRSIPPAFDAARQMVRLTELLMNYSRGGQLNIESVEINAVIEKLLLRFRQKVSEKINLYFEKDNGEIFLEADRVQIETVLQGIIQNSVDAIREKGRIEIRVGSLTAPPDINLKYPDAEPFRKYTAIMIRDNGQGMDQHTLDNLFDPFFSTRFPGRGMGMAAAYGIITAHGGWIEAVSGAPDGTCVSVYVPS